VLPARLHAERPTGGQVECFLLRPLTADTWRCLIRPGKKLPVGATFRHPSGAFTGEIVTREADGSASVKFTTRDDAPITEIANSIGGVPLPPYIRREDESHRAEDLERYQTVYANRAKTVAVAAPTAGLHFTPEVIAAVAAKGVATADITLHVGLGTFKPMLTETVEAHAIHHESYELPATTIRALRTTTGRRIAVGTTTVRTLEDFLTHGDPGASTDYFGEAALFIYPPYRFRGIDALITNFHQPRSTLLCLVAAFLAPGSTDGIAWLHEIYADAIAREYRFFSYGDAMLIV
jgi:S-adenosylmethionine:tRNA ribosyltransferase-isomerase